jgi:hypothetical protein
MRKVESGGRIPADSELCTVPTSLPDFMSELAQAAKFYRKVPGLDLIWATDCPDLDLPLFSLVLYANSETVP